VGKSDPNADAPEFEGLSHIAQRDAREWKFNCEELHARRWTGSLAGPLAAGRTLSSPRSFPARKPMKPISVTRHDNFSMLILSMTCAD